MLHIFPNLSTLNSSWILFDYHSEIWQNFSDEEPHWKRKWIRPWCGLIFANLTLVTISALLSHYPFHLRLVLSYRPCSDRILSRNFPDQLSHSSSLGGFVLCSIALWDDLNHSTYHDGCFCLSYYTGSSLKMGTKLYSSWRCWCLTNGCSIKDGWNAQGTPHLSAWYQTHVAYLTLGQSYERGGRVDGLGYIDYDTGMIQV